MKKIEQLAETVSVLFLFLMLVLCLMQVVFRYVLKISMPFTDEFARMSYIWLVFLMMPALENRDEQIKVMYFFDKLPRKAKVGVYCAMTLMYVLALLVLVVGSWRMMFESSNIVFGVTPWLTVSYQYIPLLIGSLLSIPVVICRAFHIQRVLKQAEDTFNV